MIKYKSILSIVSILFILVTFISCSNSENDSVSNEDSSKPFQPIDINKNSQDGLTFLSKIQGHWIGSNQVMNSKFDWFSFDFRAIASSHVFAIYEGGSRGNLLVSFFVSDFQNTRTIMAKNGGIFHGTYRTSYFVMDQMSSDANGDQYRFVDAKGGGGTMHMSLRFKNDSLYFDAYTSKLGENSMPTQHMEFKAKKTSQVASDEAAKTYGFPKNEIAIDFSKGFNETDLYVAPGLTESKTATFLDQRKTTEDVFALAKSSKDPYTIADHKTLTTVELTFDKTAAIENSNIEVYFSSLPLVDVVEEKGLFKNENFNSVFQFPEIFSNENSFTLTYMHQGRYYVTAVADLDNNSIPSSGDLMSKSEVIQLQINQTNQHQFSDIKFVY